MFQACVSISACIFYVFYEYIQRVCVYKWAYCWVKKKLPTYLPYFSVACCANTIFLSLIMVTWDSPMITLSNWEPEGHYTIQLYCIQNQKGHRLGLCTVIAPFWFSMEHRWMVITPFLDFNWRHDFFNAHIPQNNCAPLIVLWKTLSDLQTLPHNSLASVLVFACFFYFLYPSPHLLGMLCFSIACGLLQIALIRMRTCIRSRKTTNVQMIWDCIAQV